MQEEMNDGIGIVLADERVVIRIGDTLDPVELVAFQTRRTGMLLAGYNMF
jgi:hypothetical protein